MTTHGLSIAKASLLASCLRPSPSKLSRDDLTVFHDLLETSISSCTPTNIQNSKEWLLQHVLPSSTRTTAWAKYLVSLSKNIPVLPQDTLATRSCRRQLHLLYLVNDILHHVKHHAIDENIRRNVREHVPTGLPELFANAASERKKRTVKRLQDLIAVWEEERYCEDSAISNLKEILETGLLRASSVPTKDESKPSSRELPWIMPATHGDPSAPFFDLPTANLMPHIVPNSSRPMRPDDIRALQLNPGPADEALVNAVKDFLKDVKSIDNPYAALEDEGTVPEIDEMGQISYKNEADDIISDTYYGWSKAFCEKMKSRGKEGSDGQRGRSHSLSSSRSSSVGPRKRRRYSSSRSRSKSRSRSRSRSHSRSRSSYGNKSPQRHNSGPRRSSPPLHPSRSFSPRPQRPQHPQRHGSHQFDNVTPAASVPTPPTNTTTSSFRPTSITTNPMPVPPSRPLNWQGPWPPPPPPPPSGFTGQFSNTPYPPQSHGNFNQYGYGQR